MSVARRVDSDAAPPSVMPDLRFLAAPDYEIVCWADGCVVFDAIRGQTHELSLHAGRVALILRGAREPLSADDIGQQLAPLVLDQPGSLPDPAQTLGAILKELARVGIAIPQRA